MDYIEYKLLNSLQKNARLTNLELAKKVGLSASPCLRRVKTLEENGVITGYSAIINQTHEEILGAYDKSRLKHLYRKLYKHWDYKIEKKHYFFEFFLRFNIENKINNYNFFVNRMIIFKLLLKNLLNIKNKKIIDLI